MRKVACLSNLIVTRADLLTYRLRLFSAFGLYSCLTDCRSMDFEALINATESDSCLTLRLLFDNYFKKFNSDIDPYRPWSNEIAHEDFI